MTLSPLDGELYTDGIGLYRCCRCLHLEDACTCGRPIDRPAASDALFDTSPIAMAARFGQLAITRIRAGREPYEAARLAGSFGRQALTEETTTTADDDLTRGHQHDDTGTAASLGVK